MSTSPGVDPSDARRLRRLLERAVAAYEQRGPEGLEEFLRASGSDADRLRARLEVLQASGLLERDPRGAESESDASLPPALGEFEPLEKLGEGAMGVVWLAEQPSLRRRVALKVLRPEFAWLGGARERFRREAEAVARLRHPAIVEIHAIGEDQGVAYLAFEYVEGVSLDRLLQELARRTPGEIAGPDALAIVAALDRRGPLVGETPPLFRGRWHEVVARILLGLGEAFVHAHARGILHRDLKPSNVMLTREGTVHLLDFGLAASEGAPSLTRDGAAPGSLAYMAPELLATTGARADVRSEVYALGICAYELLRLRPAFDGRSAVEVRARILSGTCEALHPRRDSLPSELLALVETAMDRSPARRYEDATAFVADLRRLLAHEPLRARRAGSLLRSWRWVQRHPVTTTALAASVLLVVAIPSAIALQQAADAASVRASLLRENDARNRAEASARALVRGVDRMLVDVAALDLRSAPGADATRRKILDEASELLIELREREGDGPEIRRALLHARWRRARLLLEQDRLAEGEEAIRVAEEASESLLPGDVPEDEAFHLTIEGATLRALLARTRGEAQRSLEILEALLARIEARLLVRPEDAELWRKRARRSGEAAASAGLLRRFELAFEHFEDAEQSYARLLELVPQGDVYGERGEIRVSLAGVHGTTGDPEAATNWARLAAEDLEAALSRSPENETYHEALANAWQVRAVSALLTSDPDAETEAILRCAEERRWLVARFPERDSAHIAIAESCRDLSRLHRSGGPLENEPEAQRLLREAAEHLRRVREVSSDRDFVLGMVLHDLASAAETDAERVEHLREALALCRGLQAQDAHRARSSQLACAVAARLAQTLIGADRYDEAAPAAAEAQALAQLAFELRPDIPQLRARAIQMALLRADLAAVGGDPDAGVAILRELHTDLPLALADLDLESRTDELREAPAMRAFTSNLK